MPGERRTEQRRGHRCSLTSGGNHSLDQPLLDLSPLTLRFGEAGREYVDHWDLGGNAIPDGVQHRVPADNDDRIVDPAWCLGQGGIGPHPLDPITTRIDRNQAPLEACSQQTEDIVAPLAPALGGTNDGNGPRRECLVEDLTSGRSVTLHAMRQSSGLFLGQMVCGLFLLI